MSDPKPPTADATDSLECWHVGSSASAAELVAGEGAVVVAALFGTVDDSRPTAPGARYLVEQVWSASLADELFGAAEAVLHGAAEAVDDALRRRYSPSDLDGRGTVAIAVLDHGAFQAGGTAEAVAFHVRKGRVLATWLARDGDRDHPSGHVHRFAGGRPSDAGVLEPAMMDDPWQIAPGDRVLLATRDVRAWIPESELGSLAMGGDPESVAQTLAAAVGVRGQGLEVSVAAMEWAVPAGAGEVHAADEEWSDILGALEGLVDHLTDPGLDEVDLEAARYSEDDEDETTTDFAPVRERESHDGEAVLSLSPEPVPPEVTAELDRIEREQAALSTDEETAEATVRSDAGSAGNSASTTLQRNRARAEQDAADVSERRWMMEPAPTFPPRKNDIESSAESPEGQPSTSTLGAANAITLGVAAVLATLVGVLSYLLWLGA